MGTKNENGKELSKNKRKDFFSAVRNSLYLTSSKAFIVAVIAVLTFFCASQFLNVILLYTKEEAYVINAFTQGPRFDYRESEPFKKEVQHAFENILEYSLRYQDPEGFSNPDLVRFMIQDENENCEKQIKTVLEILGYQTEHNAVSEEYIQNGFVTENASKTYTINESAVREYYRKQYDDFIESRKRVDEDYNTVATYLDSLNSVQFAVFDHSKNRLVSNADVQTVDEAQKHFSSLENCLMVFDSKNPYYIPGSLQDLFPLVQEIAENYEQDFDIFVSFSGGIVFNEECKNIESEYNEIYALVAKHIAAAVILGAVGLFLSVILLRVSGRREFNGGTKYALSDKLPNELHILVHVLIAASMLILTENSVYLILNPHLNTTWLTIDSNYLMLRAEVCSSIFVLFTLAAICCIKRHVIHKTLISNTIIYKVVTAVKKMKEKK